MITTSGLTGRNTHNSLSRLNVHEDRSHGVYFCTMCFLFYSNKTRTLGLAIQSIWVASLVVKCCFSKMLLDIEHVSYVTEFGGNDYKPKIRRLGNAEQSPSDAFTRSHCVHF